ncbi:hypothetical protein Q7C36_017828 [Tachysurus vachellii]|uniref:Uncharacterized protein n=1 Tax=Tachysurus vachellii TaxID=175792 RepID=A0AA88S4L7_TACVA|nr:hypothetical protein Q7C36_017828 [Tachysurus vachellii]
MKAMIVLLAAAFAFGAPHQNLKSIIKGCSNICHEKELCKSVFVKALKNKTNMCEVRHRQAEFFCQAEKVLSEVKFPTVTPHCNVTKLLRNLNVYNNGMNCTVPKIEVEIDLGSFLEDLKECAKKVFSMTPPTQFSQ